MAYCFVCGGSLPKWEPAPSEQPLLVANEEREARELVARCSSFHEILSVLGKPDYLEYARDDSELFNAILGVVLYTEIEKGSTC